MSFQIYFTDELHGRERIRVCVSDSEEEFRNTTVEELKRKLIPGDQRKSSQSSVDTCGKFTIGLYPDVDRLTKNICI